MTEYTVYQPLFFTGNQIWGVQNLAIPASNFSVGEIRSPGQNLGNLLKIPGIFGKLPESLESFQNLWKVSGNLERFPGNMQCFLTLWKVFRHNVVLIHWEGGGKYNVTRSSMSDVFRNNPGQMLGQI